MGESRPPRDAVLSVPGTNCGRESPTATEQMQFRLEMRRVELEVKEKWLMAERLAALQLELEKVRLAAEKEKEQMALEKEKLRMAHEIELERVRSQRVPPPALASPDATFPTFHAGDDPDTFMDDFEQACLDHDIPEADYMKTLRPRLSDALAEVAADLGPGDRNNYSLFKETVRAVLGLTPEYYRRRFRSMKPKPHELLTLYVYHLRRALDMWLQAAGVKTVQDLIDLFVLEHLLLKLPEEIRQPVLEKNPKTAQEAATMADNIELNLQPMWGRAGGRHNWNRCQEAPASWGSRKGRRETAF